MMSASTSSRTSVRTWQSPPRPVARTRSWNWCCTRNQVRAQRLRPLEQTLRSRSAPQSAHGRRSPGISLNAFHKLFLDLMYRYMHHLFNNVLLYTLLFGNDLFQTGGIKVDTSGDGSHGVCGKLLTGRRIGHWRSWCDVPNHKCRPNVLDHWCTCCIDIGGAGVVGEGAVSMKTSVGITCSITGTGSLNVTAGVGATHFTKARVLDCLLHDLHLRKLHIMDDKNW